jgi:DNA-binding LytR/AlgR family response regulator
MNITALIAEDEPLLAEGLKQDLAALWPQLQIVASVGDGAAAVEHALALRPQVCFFDIRMPGMSGLEAAQALAEDWPGDAPFPLIVFVTAFDQYALHAFDAQAVDYVVKPVQRERLAACVARLQARLSSRGSNPEVLQQSIDQLRAILATPLGSTALPATSRLDVIQAQVGQTVHLVPIDDVVYFEAADKYVRVITADKEHLIRLSLKELLPQLDAQRFWQVHRGTIVQARCIAQARREESGKVTLFLRGRPETLTASRLYAHLFKGQ